MKFHDFIGADKIDNEGIYWMFKKIFWGVELDNLTFIHDSNDITHFESFVEVVCDKHNGLLKLLQDGEKFIL